MEKSHPVFHLLLPTNLVTKAVPKLKSRNRCKLVGLWVKSTPSFIYSSKDSTIVHRNYPQFEPLRSVTVTIFGLQFDANAQVNYMKKQDFTINGNPKFKIMGELVTSGITSRFAAESVELPSLWITLCVNKNKIMVEQICLDNLMLLPNPENIVIIEYNPEWLKYCIYTKTARIESIIEDAFQLSHIFPSDNKNVRLLPDAQEPETETDETNKPRTSVSKIDKFFHEISNRSLGLKQVMQKVHNFAEIAVCRQRIQFLDLLIVILLDTFLGLLLTFYLLQYSDLFGFLHMKIDSVVKLLQQILQWLRGSPAGFKLNDALNSLLWRFFSYHLHLWGNYIGMLQPILSLMLTLVVQVGVLGVTVQIALMKDLLSITTFHIYCLYIYASRLYAIQLKALKSLGRLFYGRKWNPLRNRVDSVQLKTSEMFISSLIFTIAIFLAPTIFIYYGVFLSLRLPVLTAESVLFYSVKAMNALKLVTSILIVTNSPRVANETYLRSVNREGMVTFEVRIQTNRKVFKSFNIFHIVGNVIRKLLLGELL